MFPSHLPDLFVAISRLGAGSMSLRLDDAQETIDGSGIILVECPDSAWTFKYDAGYDINLRGSLAIQVYIDDFSSGTSILSSDSYKILGLTFVSRAPQVPVSTDSVARNNSYSMHSTSSRYPRIHDGTRSGIRSGDIEYKGFRASHSRATTLPVPVNGFGIPGDLMNVLQVCLL